MKAHLGAQQEDPDVLMDINTTPLIDVMLVLLIMFIVTIPIQPHATSLLLAQGPALSVAEPRVVNLRILQDERIEMDGKPVASREEFARALADLAELAGPADPAPSIDVDVHAQARYEVVAAVLAQIQRAGLRKLSIAGIDRFAAQ